MSAYAKSAPSTITNAIKRQGWESGWSAGYSAGLHDGGAERANAGLRGETKGNGQTGIPQYDHLHNAADRSTRGDKGGAEKSNYQRGREIALKALGKTEVDAKGSDAFERGRAIGRRARGKQ